MLHKISKAASKRIFSVFLAAVLIIGTCVIPVAVPAYAADVMYQKTYTFNEDSGTQYGDVYITDSAGIERQISRAHFSKGTDGEEAVLKISNTLMSTNSGPSGYLFNDTDGLFELMPSKTYTVSLRVKVVSSQVSFVSGSYTYPVSSQLTQLKLAYGMPAVNASDSVTMDTEIGLVAEVGTGTTTFTATQDGTKNPYNIGEWYEFSYEFTTPEEFGKNGNVLGFGLKSFNGVEILIDDVNVEMYTAITVDPGVGTISQTEFPHKIGDKIAIEDPVYKFGYGFEGWFTDSACTNEFTDTIVTEENCNIKLYAGWSDTHFSLEGYVPSHTDFGFGNYFYDIIEDENAPDGTKILEYHYTSEYYNAIRSGSVEEGNIVYWSTRRTQRENNISLKKVESNTSYVVTFKYKVPANMGDSYIYMATGNSNVWVDPPVYVEYLDSRMTLTAENPDMWQEGRMAFTTGDLLTNANVAFIRLYATGNIDTVVYLDDIRIEKVEGDTSVTLNANGGAFVDGSTQKVQKVTVGDNIDTLEPPVRENYDFGSWYFDENCAQPVTAETVDGTVYLNTLYAGWTKDMGFEGYYYDLESENRNNYVSDTVSIVKENVHKGFYSAKLVNENSSNQNVIALNPIHDTTRYLVTFHYSAENITDDVKIQFATMNYDVNNADELNIYDEVYTVTTEDMGKGYLMGAVIIETAFKTANAGRLVMLVSSDTAADYTVYFDTVSVKVMDMNEGYVIFTDEITGEHKAVTGTLGEEVEGYEPSKVTDKFLGWYTDRNTTALYEGGYTYSDTLTRLYAGWVLGEGFEDYAPADSNITVTQDEADKNNKYLTVSTAVSEKIADVTSGKKYGVEIRYNLEAADGDVTVAVGGESQTVKTNEVGTGWNNTAFVLTADSSELYLNITPAATATLHIDDVIVYEITEDMSVITFDQEDGYGEDAVRVGVKGTTVSFPAVPVNGTDVFYGWYADSALTTAYTSKTFAGEDVTVYARWASDPIINVTFDDLDTENLPFNETNSNTTYLYSKSKQSGTYSMAFDRQSEETYDTYVPLANAQGLVKLESNTTYAVSFWYYFPAYSSGNTMKFNFYCASADAYDSKTVVGKVHTIEYATGWRVGYTYITTGELDDTNNVLYIAITGGNKKNTLYLDSFKFTRVDEGRNHVFAYDSNNRKLYEIDGNYGEPIDYPEIASAHSEVEGWYTDSTVLVAHSSGTHNQEKITNLYCRWDLSDINFDNYQFEGSDSKYTVGDDISLSAEENYDTVRSLKYSYNYAIKYFETSNNAASMGRVNDDSTYRISFRYKMTESQGDVDIKFLTAHLNNRWSFITDYDKATYRIYSGEIGDSWKQATVYLTTDFASIGTSGLFMTFNPVTEGDTVIYIDDVDIDYLGSDTAVVAFQNQNNNAGYFVEAKVGDTVSAPETAPKSQFASFNGWYSDEECATEYTPAELTAGITYVYSGWTANSEDFSSYGYKSNKTETFASGNSVENGVLTYTANEAVTSVKDGLRLGKLTDNTSYKITFDYKASSENTGIKFATANEMSIFENTTAYLDEGNFVTAVADGQWHTATVYITASFAYTVPNDKYVNVKENKNAVYGDMLYMYFTADSGASVSIDNIALTQVEALSNAGASALTEEACELANDQALRFYFGYKAENYIFMNIGGEDFTLVERGMIFKNARNTATGTVTEKGVTVNAITLQNTESKGHFVTGKTYGFNSYWDYDNKTGEIIYSGYINEFYEKDTRLTAARGYIKVKDSDGNIYTLYSADKKTDVKENVEREAEITDVDVHTFGEVSWDNFTIVNPKLMPYIYGQQIELLMEYANDTHSVTLNRVTEKAEEVTYEIVIGDTSREASSLVTVEDENSYVIAMIGTKLVIKGGSDLATMQGVKDFIEYLKLKDSLDCGAKLYDGFVKEGSVSATADDYALTFNDEFEGSTLDTSIWGAYNNENINSAGTPSQLGGTITKRAPTDPGYTTATGREVEAPVFIRDGNAVVTTARLNDTDFTFSRMSTFWNMNYQYGMLEFNVKLAPTPVHTSLWMNGAATGNSSYTKLFGRESRGCMTEYDLLENFGRENYFAANIHYWWSATSVKDKGHSSLDGVSAAGNKNQYYVPDADETALSDNYHIFTFLWNNDTITFALDGVKFYEFENTSEYYDRMPNYIIIGLGMGNRDYGSTYDIETHSDYYECLLDYVRLYQIENMGSRLNYAKK